MSSWLSRSLTAVKEVLLIPFAAANLLVVTFDVMGHGAYQLFNYGYWYRKTRFGLAGQLLYVLHFIDTDALQQMHWNINTWTDEEIYTWKQSQLNTYNAITVAVCSTCLSDHERADSMN